MRLLVHNEGGQRGAQVSGYAVTEHKEGQGGAQVSGYAVIDHRDGGLVGVQERGNAIMVQRNGGRYGCWDDPVQLWGTEMWTERGTRTWVCNLGA